MNQDQINSLVRTVIKIVGSALVTHGMTQAASILNTEDVIGAVVIIVGVIWSHLDNKTIPPTQPVILPSSQPKL